jgi:hypothetical protein
MHDRAGVALAVQPTEVWPPDDTEESVLGANLHQTAITNLRLGLNELAALEADKRGVLPWLAGGQTMISGFRRPDGSGYTTLPDVFVYDHAFDLERASFTLAEDGPPLLIIEVLSPETQRSDRDLERGKGYSYARAGVPEYLVLDPSGAYLAEQGQGWRLARGTYQPWPRGADGLWHSREFAVALGLEGVQVAVHAADGHRVLREGENERERQRLRREITAKDAELAALRRRLERLGQSD